MPPAMRCLLVPLTGALSLLMGCPGGDLCVPEADSERVVHVQPPSRPGPDNKTVTDTFWTIQSALNAVGGDRGRATVCVADGAYHEQLRVPADTHIIAAGSVRIRPPQTRDDALPTSVDRVLLTLDTGPEGPIVIDGLDLRAGGLCIDAAGSGSAVLRDMTVVDCAVGLRARDGTNVTLHEVALEDHSVRGIDLMGATLRTESHSTILRNGRPALGQQQLELNELDPEMGWVQGLAPGRGALIAADSSVTLVNTSIDESEYRGGLLDMTGGSLTLRDVVLGAQRSPHNPEGFVAGEAGGDGPLIVARGTEVDIDGLFARSEHQGLFALSDGTNAFVRNVDWSGRAPTTSPEGAPGPALDASGGGTIVLWHASLYVSEGAPGIRITGETEVTLDVANTIVWGHGEGAGILIEGTQPDLDVRYSLFQDNTVTGTQMVAATDPGWEDSPQGLLISGTSPARCTGAGNLEVTTDLLGNLRPFEVDKAPDLGAIELQQACP